MRGGRAKITLFIMKRYQFTKPFHVLVNSRCVLLLERESQIKRSVEMRLLPGQSGPPLGLVNNRVLWDVVRTQNVAALDLGEKRGQVPAWHRVCLSGNRRGCPVLQKRVTGQRDRLAAVLRSVSHLAHTAW